MPGTRLFVFARHAESTANASATVSSDPARLVRLTSRGRRQARQLGVQLAGIDIDLAIATRLARTQQTVQLALEHRNVTVLVEPGLDEIDAGDLDGAPIVALWDWERRHDSNERLPQGESVSDALLRYASSLRRMLSRAEPVTLVVLHEFALRQIVQAVSGRPPLAEDFANAVPFLLDERAVARAVAGLETVARSPRPEPTR